VSELTQAGGSEKKPTPSDLVGADPRKAPSPKRTPADLVAAWNLLADRHELPKSEPLSPQRARQASARIRDGVLDRWPELESAIAGSPFLRGHGERGWKADMEWLLRPDKWKAAISRHKAGVGPGAKGAEKPETETEREIREIYERAATQPQEVM